MKKFDLIKQCMQDIKAPPQKARDFQVAFCERCLNSDCKRAGLSDDIWFQRISTQVERLLENPTIAPFNDPRFEEIVRQKFEDRRNNALKIELISKREDWTIPTDEDVAAYKQFKEQPTLFKHEPDDVQGLIEQNIPEDVQEPDTQEVVSQAVPEPQKRPEPSTPQKVQPPPSNEAPFVPAQRDRRDVHAEANTPMSQSGMMVGAPPGTTVKKNQGSDPWSVSSKEEFVDLGAKITLKKKKSNH
jgi:hypothetical protein